MREGNCIVSDNLRPPKFLIKIYQFQSFYVFIKKKKILTSLFHMLINERNKKIIYKKKKLPVMLGEQERSL